MPSIDLNINCNKLKMYNTKKIIVFVLIILSCLSAKSQSIAYTPLYTSANFVKTIDLSKPVGEISASFEANPSGGVSYSIPINVSPGTNGLQPAITITYNSQSGSGIAGMGWNISGLSSISRAGKDIYHNGIVKPISYTAIDDAFLLDGMKLNPITGNNGANGTIYAGEVETFAKIISYASSSPNNPDWFKVTSKDGSIMEFGNSADSRILTDNGQNTLSWRLNKIIDINGNYIEFKYDNAGRDSRISQILYTGNTTAGLQPYNQVNFSYGLRADPNTIYEAGASVTTQNLLNKIFITHTNDLGNSSVIKTYKLNYGFDNINSFLKEVIEYGGDESSTSLNSTIFLYGEQPQNLVGTSTDMLQGSYDFYPGDFDADGKTDLLAAHKYFDPNASFQLHTDYSLFKEVGQSSSALLYNKQLPQGTSIQKPADGKSFNFLTADYDGDGRDDILQVNTNLVNLYCNGYRSKVNNITANFTKSHNPNTSYTDYVEQTFPYPAIASGSYLWISDKAKYFIPGDFDGDGKQDYILILGKRRDQGVCYLTPEYTYPSYAYDYKAFITNPGTNEVNNEIDNFGVGTNTYGTGFYAGTIANADMINVLDFDGDGKMEILVTVNNQTFILSLQRISPNSGYYFSASVLYTTTAITKDTKYFIGDFNADRKTDLLIRNVNGTWNILYSTGTAFLSTPFSFNQNVAYSNNSITDKILVADFNGDGKADILHGYSVWINGTASTSKLSLYYAKGISTSSFYYEQYDYDKLLGADLVPGDFNGDGRTDILNRISASTSSPSYFISIKPFGMERLLKKITTGHNITTTLDYKLLTDKNSYPYFYDRTVSLDDPSNTNPYNFVQLPMYALSTTTTPDGIGGNNVTDYSYEDAVLHRQGKGFMGFKKIIAKNNVTGITAITENDINTQFAVPYSVKQSTILTATGEQLSELKNTTSFIDLSTSSSDKRFLQETIKVLNIDHHNGAASENTNTYDVYGNVTNVITKAGVLSGNTVNPIETSETITTYSIHNTPVPLKPDNITITNTRIGMPPISTATAFTYTSNGLLATQTNFNGLPGAITLSYVYNNLGNSISATTSTVGANSRTILTTFDAKGRFILQTQKIGSGLSQTESFVTDSKWGSVLSKTSTDCLTTTYLYDNFARLIQTTLPDGNTVTETNNWEIGGDALFYTLKHWNGGKPDTKIHFDKWQRQWKIETAGTAGTSNWHTVITTYDKRGNIYTKTNSFFPTTETPRITTNTFDVYNRPATVVNYMGTISYNYSKPAPGNIKIEVINTDGQITSQTIDGSGKTITSIDNGGQLNFIYNSIGNQVEIIHGTTSIMQSVYDIYGRQISLTDNNTGTLTYSYDNYGQLKQQADANGNVTTMTYDDFGRIVSRTGGEGTTTYEYYKDLVTGCSNNSITKVTGFNGVIKQYTFDSYKRPLTEKQTINGQDYITSFTYNSYGQISKVTYPSGLDIFTNYDANGYLLSKNHTSNLPKTQLFRNGVVDGEGKYTSYILGNNLATNKTYNNDFLATSYTPGVQNVFYDFDASTGRLMQRADNNKGQLENFSYDNLNRLTGFNVNNNQYNASSTFDGITGSSMGNIVAKTDAGYYKYKTDKIHAVAYTMDQPVPGQSVVTPAPVSVISTAQQLITYTPFLKAQSITEDNYQLNFIYGPDYERVKTELLLNGATQETRYFLGDYEKQIKNGVTREIHYVNGGDGICAIIVKENGVTTPYIVYTDHLGSIVSVTDTKANIVAEQNFDAWGRRRPANKWYTYYPLGGGNMASLPDWLYRGYTGHEMLPQFNLINMNGRIYDPILGRMLSPDNYVSTPYGTQGYNRYAYALNNPLTYIDKDGNFPWLAFAIGAIIGGYSGGVMANGSFNPGKWDWSSGRTWGGIFGGALIGGASSALGATVAASGMPFANTAGIVSTSFTNSIGMGIISGGKIAASISFGIGSYNFASGELNFLGKQGNSFLENVGYVFGGLANVQDAFAGIHGVDVKYQAESEHGIPHARAEGTYENTKDIDISVAHVNVTDLPYKYNGDNKFLNGLDYAQAWMRTIKPGLYYQSNADGLSWTLHNVNGKWLANMTQRIKNGQGLFGIGKLKYGTTLFGCQSHVAHALLGVGVFTLPINIHPLVLYSQLVIRQMGIYASPYLQNK